MLTEVFVNHETYFEDTPSVHNIITKTVLPHADAKEFSNQTVEGEKLHDAFRIERLEGDKSIWNPMTKRRLVTFTSKKEEVKVKLQNKAVTLKEEWTLMTCFIIGSRKRPEMDLQNYLGSDEFSAVPRSMFSSNGQVLLASDKATIMHQLQTLVQSSIENYQQIEGTDEVNRGHVILFDGMAVVNRLKLGSPIINRQQFAEAFFRIIQEKSSHAEEVRVIFDCYIDHSLKGGTHEKRRTYTPVQYEVQDDTPLKNLTLKKFLLHIERDLKVYLGKYLGRFTEEQIAFAVSFKGTAVTTINSINPQLLESNYQ